ncbi:MAG: dihydroorotate dehydrogenase electron transfer subunit [Candidatus Bathyarchaeota archaeon]|nr:dihydroorotate dehydrogenase electron transfer subunit [Candidatus Bathyarchaeum tardum]WGM90534.1 MAG: dihydroorotate dehydrogenase electron transfer subunit [Candidatus Bathyarchaeum tardum]WNZ29391.1 MAG: dihydroorotate dehydrogenase electron transfer subunit [Candidatus Bathyarchaeota archaeon]
MQYNSHKCSHSSPIEAANRMRTVELLEVKQENCSVKTLTFEDPLCSKAEPGQFVMVWIPGVDEIPISLSGIASDGLTSITVNAVGDASSALNLKKKGEIIGVRGPFGNGFVPVKGNVLVVGGGTGLGPMMPLTENLVRISSKITVMSGVKCQDNLLFLDRIADLLSSVDSETICTTEDGSYGFEGLVTSQVEKKLAAEHVDMIYTCGPEPMMYRIFLLAEQYNVPVQASLERIMRCGIGLCGSCVIGELRVCKDGPVLNSEQLRSIKDEFGKFRLDWTGKKVKQ